MVRRRKESAESIRTFVQVRFPAEGEALLAGLGLPHDLAALKELYRSLVGANTVEDVRKVLSGEK